MEEFGTNRGYRSAALAIVLILSPNLWVTHYLLGVVARVLCILVNLILIKPCDRPSGGSHFSSRILRNCAHDL